MHAVQTLQRKRSPMHYIVSILFLTHNKLTRPAHCHAKCQGRAAGNILFHGHFRTQRWQCLVLFLSRGSTRPSIPDIC